MPASSSSSFPWERRHLACLFFVGFQPALPGNHPLLGGVPQSGGVGSWPACFSSSPGSAGLLPAYFSPLRAGSPHSQGRHLARLFSFFFFLGAPGILPAGFSPLRAGSPHSQEGIPPSSSFYYFLLPGARGPLACLFFTFAGWKPTLPGEEPAASQPSARQPKPALN